MLQMLFSSVSPSSPRVTPHLFSPILQVVLTGCRDRRVSYSHRSLQPGHTLGLTRLCFQKYGVEALGFPGRTLPNFEFCRSISLLLIRWGWTGALLGIDMTSLASIDSELKTRGAHHGIL